MGWIRAVALDLDGTIAADEIIASSILDAIKDARYRGVRVVLVTGRTADSVGRHFPGLLEDFDVAVVENGGVLIADGCHRLLGEPVDPALVAALAEQGVPVQRGELLVAVSAQHDVAALHEVGRLGLDCTLLRNRAELMIVPSGISKGTGLLAALNLLGLSPHNCLAVGDAENDHSMFDLAELAAAPTNAIPAVLHHADLTLEAADGAGVAELLAGPVIRGERRPTSRRRQMRIGTFPDGTPVRLPTSPSTMVIAGGSGRGKSYLAGVVAEQLISGGYHVLLIDPEGEQSALEDAAGMMALRVGDLQDVALAVDALRSGSSVVLDLSGTAKDGLDAVLGDLLARVVPLRAELGYPQWVIIDEAHNLAGPNGRLRPLFDPTAGGHCLVTFRPDLLCAEILTDADVIISTSPPIDQMLGTADLPASGLPKAVTGQAVLLRTDRVEPGRPFQVTQRSTHHRRHRRKYTDLPLPPGKGFRFRGPNGAGLPEARTVGEFRDQLDDVDPDTLNWHLRRGDLSRWVGDVVQDRELAVHIIRLEHELAARQAADIAWAREQLADAVDARYGA
ncbi:hypothetical protein SAMN04515671_4328 [Nakamurella panacisegetis]|uniref:AAA+ ATPase domain-containing protein n=1 Tax=Nakamurella panacisegetis TaxID=1090615 RepID=A0A1H0SWD6_9ACTN|nr:HAD hydrolase family protein [Nakamurella panacisegetis]SDP45994.1 hypothetical protein SAMN04515671_4328 [Nakamurella panacisegetis]